MRTTSIDRARDDPGFTLVEILLAIVLVGVVGAVVAIGIGRLTDQAADATCAASADAARTGANTFYVRQGAYPTTLTDLTTPRPGAGADLQSPTGSTVAGLTLSTANWTLTMAIASATTPPTFACTTGPPSLTGAANGVTAVVTANYARPYLGESIVRITNTAPITSLTVTVTIAATPGVSFLGQYSDFAPEVVDASSTTATGAIVYTFTLLAGQTIDPGTWIFDAQTDGADSAHPSSGDTWSVTSTSNGVTATLSGTF